MHSIYDADNIKRVILYSDEDFNVDDYDKKKDTSVYIKTTRTVHAFGKLNACSYIKQPAYCHGTGKVIGYNY